MANRVLDRNKAQPMYVQLANVLREQVLKQPPGSRFPGDDELCEQFSVSKPVVRGAMAMLVEEGHLNRRRGKGTFVRHLDRTGPPSRSGTIAVVAPLSGYTPHAGALSGIEPVAEAAGFSAMLKSAPTKLFDPEAAADLLEDLSNKVSGIIWINPHYQQMRDACPLSDDLKQRTVFINIQFMDPGVTSVLSDYESASKLACRHLVQAGCKSIGFVGANGNRYYSQVRRRAYLHHMAERDLIIPDGWDIEHVGEGQQMEPARQCVEHLLRANKERPDGVFACTDAVARGVIAAIEAAGLKVPEDMAVVGFDDSPMATERPPGLTTFRLPFEELGKAAFLFLLDQVREKRVAGGRLFLPCPIVVRESCGARAKM